VKIEFGNEPPAEHLKKKTTKEPGKKRPHVRLARRGRTEKHTGVNLELGGEDLVRRGKSGEVGVKENKNPFSWRKGAPKD